jgi:hypothetical protein
MAKYEMIREIFNSCSGNQMRDLEFKEIETDDVEALARTYVTDPRHTFEVLDNGKGTIIYNISNSDLPERLSFTLLDD